MQKWISDRCHTLKGIVNLLTLFGGCEDWSPW
jgi:hypothetical protein